MKQEEIIKMSCKLTRREYSFLREIIKSKYKKELIDKIDKEYAMRNLKIKTLTNKINLIDVIYKNEISKLTRILADPNFIKEIGGLKLLLHGETGTGKTYLVKRLKEINSNLLFKFLSLEEIVSAKMGQTQINLLTLAGKLNNESENKQFIVFIDELDSIVGNRLSEDLGERKKIASTFIKFLDQLEDNIIVFAATNYINDIDDSIQRRFSFQIQGVKLSSNEFINCFDLISEFKLTRKKTQIEKVVNKTFTISNVYDFKNYLSLESRFSNVQAFPEFIIFFKLQKEFQDSISVRNKKYIKRKSKSNGQIQHSR